MRGPTRQACRKESEETDMHHVHTAEAAENVKSIRRIPESLLPNGLARKTLVGMAQDGYDVYAYTPLQIGVKDAEKR